MRARWTLTLGAVACVLLGTAFALGDVRYSGAFAMPRHFGYYVVIGSLAAGVFFGGRGCALPALGTAAFGVTRWLQATISPSGDDQRQVIIMLFVFVLPAAFAAIAAVGAVLSNVVRNRASLRSQ